MGIADRLRGNQDRGGAPRLDVGKGMLADHPSLADFLTADSWADGSVRQLPTLILFAEDGRWKACLNDRAEERSAWVTSDTLEGLFAVLDAQLESGTTDWRGGFQKGKGRGR